jgi:acyl dehydratase
MAGAEPAKGLLYLEDLAVGDRFVTGTHTLTRDEIIAFARQYDPQPFHTDEEAAKNTFFKGLAASGWHTSGVTIRLLVEGGLPLAEGVIGAGVEIAWPQPTRPGDTLRVVSEILDIKPSQSRPDRAIVTVRSETLNQRDEAAQVMTSKLVVFRRPA